MTRIINLKPVKIWYKPNEDGSIKLFVYRQGHPIEELSYFNKDDIFILEESMEINE